MLFYSIVTLVIDASRDSLGRRAVYVLRRVVTQLCLQIPLQSITAFSLPPSSHSLSLSTASVANLLHWSTIGKTDRRMVVRCNKMGYPIRIVSPSPCGLQDVESSRVCVWKCAMQTATRFKERGLSKGNVKYRILNCDSQRAKSGRQSGDRDEAKR